MPCVNHPLVDERLTRCTRCTATFCPDCIVTIGGYPYCANCKMEAMRDLRSGVPAHQLELASIGRRFLAFWIDGFVLAIPLVLLLFAVGVPLGLFADSAPDPVATGAMVVFQLVFSLAILGAGVVYEGLMLSNGGQTLGKKAMKIKVVTPEGKDITRGQAWGRAGIRQLIALFCAIIDYIPAFGQDRATIHDQVAKTRVVSWNA